ncbi:hypothetical protein COCON_G00186780 [Conger conger]|uniref:Transmembrane protease serine 13-like n=1 Tax=Conger conger TaxID=82655 RepID=A0A9Q1D2Q2_CONCO|nr:hypothetical protein COCON_G00186780 [Conger conger]
MTDSSYRNRSSRRITAMLFPSAIKPTSHSPAHLLPVPMAQHDKSDLPPPYSEAVQIQPPSYGGLVYGMEGPYPLSQPHYIPQPGPPIRPYPTHHIQPPPRKQKRLCCGSTRCYGGSGVTAALLVLLGVAIWLGVHYSSRILLGYGSGGLVDFDGGAADEDGDGNGGGGNRPGPAMQDSCPNDTVLCDMTRDCEMGSDETVCVRFGREAGLMVKTAQDGRFLPVCSEGWSQEYADNTCAQMGFRKSYKTGSIDSQPLTALTVTARGSRPIHGLVNVSSSCPGEKTVSLACVDCGNQQSTARIIGGMAAQGGDWPWQASLHYLGAHVCGGSLVAPDFVVTAAHCFPRSSPSGSDASIWKVYLGNFTQDNLPTPYYVESIILNENYDSKTNDQDIALLKLTEPVAFSSTIQPVCLPAFNQRFSIRDKCWTTGYGRTEERVEEGSRTLMEVKVDLIDTGVCNSSRVYDGNLSKNMLCAGNLEEGGRDSCQGDSGGPLVCEAEDRRWYLVGVTSWGSGCGQSMRPGVYSNVRSLLPWVYSRMQQNRP